MTQPNSQFNLYILFWGVEYIAFVIGATSLYQLFQDLDTKPK